MVAFQFPDFQRAVLYINYNIYEQKLLITNLQDLRITIYLYTQIFTTMFKFHTVMSNVMLYYRELQGLY